MSTSFPTCSNPGASRVFPWNTAFSRFLRPCAILSLHGNVRTKLNFACTCTQAATTERHITLHITWRKVLVSGWLAHLQDSCEINEDKTMWPVLVLETTITANLLTHKHLLHYIWLLYQDGTFIKEDKHTLAKSETCMICKWYYNTEQDSSKECIIV